MRLLGTFNLKVGKRQGPGLDHCDTNTSELSFDTHIKRRKYVEALVAKSLQSEASGEVNPGEKHYLQKLDSLEPKSLALLERRDLKARNLELRMFEQSDNGGDHLSTMAKAAAALSKAQPAHGLKRKSRIRKADREDMMNTQGAINHGNYDKNLKEVAGHEKAAVNLEGKFSKANLDLESQTASNTPLESLDLMSGPDIKIKSVDPTCQTGLGFSSNMAQLSQLDSSTHIAGNCNQNEELLFQRPQGKEGSALAVALRNAVDGVWPCTSALVDEGVLDIRTQAPGVISLLANAANPEIEAHDSNRESVSICQKEQHSRLRHDPELELLPDFVEPAPVQDSSTCTESDIIREKSIHILGMGPVGKYIAHSLCRLEHGPCVTLLMHRPLMMQEWHDEGAAIRVLKDGKVLVASGFHVESSAEFGKRRDSRARFAGFGEQLEHTVEQPTTVINHLVVTTDPNTTVTALDSIRHRIRETSTICLVQDGLGMVETLNSTVFTDPQRRPTYVLANITHDLVSTEHRFTIIEQSTGRVSCSKLPRTIDNKPRPGSPTIKRIDFSWSPESKHLVSIFHRVPELNTSTLGHKSFYKAQLERLAVSAVIGPLSVAFDCRNDQLLYNYPASMMMKMLLKEISNIITSLPELQNLSIAQRDFSPQKLEHKVLSSINKTGTNLSPMLRAIRAGTRTNIEFINGYLIQRAVDLGIHHPVNQLLVTIVKGKHIIRKRESDGYIPFGK